MTVSTQNSKIARTYLDQSAAILTYSRINCQLPSPPKSQISIIGFHSSNFPSTPKIPVLPPRHPEPATLQRHLQTPADIRRHRFADKLSSPHSNTPSLHHSVFPGTAQCPIKLFTCVHLHSPTFTYFFSGPSRNCNAPPPVSVNSTYSRQISLQVFTAL